MCGSSSRKYSRRIKKKVVVQDRGATEAAGGIVVVAGDKVEAVGCAVEVVEDTM
jgi:hypothetical protein